MHWACCCMRRVITKAMEAMRHLHTVLIFAPADHLRALAAAEHGKAAYKRRHHPMSVARQPPPAFHVPPAYVAKVRLFFLQPRLEPS